MPRLPGRRANCLHFSHGKHLALSGVLRYNVVGVDLERAPPASDLRHQEKLEGIAQERHYETRTGRFFGHAAGRCGCIWRSVAGGDFRYGVVRAQRRGLDDHHVRPGGDSLGQFFGGCRQHGSFRAAWRALGCHQPRGGLIGELHQRAADGQRQAGADQSQRHSHRLDWHCAGAGLSGLAARQHQQRADLRRQGPALQGRVDRVDRELRSYRGPWRRRSPHRPPRGQRRHGDRPSRAGGHRGRQRRVAHPGRQAVREGLSRRRSDRRDGRGRRRRGRGRPGRAGRPRQHVRPGDQHQGHRSGDGHFPVGRRANHASRRGRDGSHERAAGGQDRRRAGREPRRHGSDRRRRHQDRRVDGNRRLGHRRRRDSARRRRRQRGRPAAQRPEHVGRRGRADHRRRDRQRRRRRGGRVGGRDCGVLWANNRSRRRIRRQRRIRGGLRQGRTRLRRDSGHGRSRRRGGDAAAGPDGRGAAPRQRRQGP